MGRALGPRRGSGLRREGRPHRDLRRLGRHVQGPRRPLRIPAVSPFLTFKRFAPCARERKSFRFLWNPVVGWETHTKGASSSPSHLESPLTLRRESLLLGVSTLTTVTLLCPPGLGLLGLTRPVLEKFSPILYFYLRTSLGLSIRPSILSTSSCRSSPLGFDHFTRSPEPDQSRPNPGVTRHTLPRVLPSALRKVLTHIPLYTIL